MSLPIAWRPKAVDDLVRYGSKHDGGYVVPHRLAQHTEHVIGLGVEDNWQFEAGFAAAASASVHCYDPSVHLKYWIRRSIHDLRETCYRRLPLWVAIRRLIDFSNYVLYFSSKRRVHFKERIGKRSNGCTDFHKIMARTDSARIFLKIDIEGAEFEILDQIMSYADRITGIVMEFHELPKTNNAIMDFLRWSEPHFQLVHLHANNGGGVTDTGDPKVVEMTWLNRRYLSENEALVERTLPIDGVDFPNVTTRPDIEITFS